MGLANLAKKLIFLFTVIPHEIMMRSTALRTDSLFRNGRFRVAENGLEFFAIAFLVILDKILPVPVLLKGDKLWKLIDFEFLVFRRLGIVKIPLFERNISADKSN